MKKHQMKRPEIKLVCLGLLVATSSSLVKDWIHLPDIFRGFLIGLGLALEFTGVILLVRRKRSMNNCEE